MVFSLSLLAAEISEDCFSVSCYLFPGVSLTARTDRSAKPCQPGAWSLAYFSVRGLRDAPSPLFCPRLVLVDISSRCPLFLPAIVA